MNLLHIISTPRSGSSNTLRVTKRFLEILREEDPGVAIDTLDLFADDLPGVAGKNIEAKYALMMGAQLDPDHVESWTMIESLIARLVAADVVVISVPMWNLSIPYALKYFIDAVVQPGYLFKYNDMGQPEGMIHGSKMIVITSRGGDYSADSPFHAFDFMEPYLRAIFGFVGIHDMEFIYAQPMDIQHRRQAAIDRALEDAADAARRLVSGAPLAQAEEVPGGMKPPVVLDSSGAHQVTLDAGEVLFEENDEPDFIYMIDDGSIEVFRSEGGRDTVLATLTAGQYFGEMGPLLGVLRTASVRGVTETKLTAYGPDEFRSEVLGR